MAMTLNGTTGIVLPTAAAPAFHAYASTTQGITAATWTKVNFVNEYFDTNNNFASSRFTPTVAGYYVLTSSVYFGTNPAPQAILNISVNGVASAGYGIGRQTTSGEGMLSGSVVAYLNGSTDYAEVYFYSQGANTISSGASGALVLFSGAMVRSA